MKQTSKISIKTRFFWIFNLKIPFTHIIIEVIVRTKLVPISVTIGVGVRVGLSTFPC